MDTNKVTTNDNGLKNILGEIANVVADLPPNLQPSAFSTLLTYRLQSDAWATQRPKASVQAFATMVSSSAENIGEYLSGFKSDLKEDEKLLAAIAFTQKGSDDNSSTIEVAHTSLKDIGIKLSNAGVFGKQLLKKKWVFAIGKAGNSMKLRISADGAAALQRLLEPREND